VLPRIAAMVDDILEAEGGFVNHANDRGGPTNFGVTQKTLSSYLGRKASIDDVKNMTIEIAIEIYVRRYFSGPRIDTLPEEIQPFIFDSSINHGPRRAVKFVQEICNACGFGRLTVDGAMGPATRTSAESANSEMREIFLACLVEERRLFFHEIVRRNETQHVFLKGWLRRADKFWPQGLDI